MVAWPNSIVWLVVKWGDGGGGGGGHWVEDEIGRCDRVFGSELYRMRVTVYRKL